MRASAQTHQQADMSVSIPSFKYSNIIRPMPLTWTPRPSTQSQKLYPTFPISTTYITIKLTPLLIYYSLHYFNYSPLHLHPGHTKLPRNSLAFAKVHLSITTSHPTTGHLRVISRVMAVFLDQWENPNIPRNTFNIGC